MRHRHHLALAHAPRGVQTFGPPPPQPFWIRERMSAKVRPLRTAERAIGSHCQTRADGIGPADGKVRAKGLPTIAGTSAPDGKPVALILPGGADEAIPHRQTLDRRLVQ